MHSLDNKVFDIIDARCNHEVHVYIVFKRHSVWTDSDTIQDNLIHQTTSLHSKASSLTYELVFVFHLGPYWGIVNMTQAHKVGPSSSRKGRGRKGAHNTEKQRCPTKNKGYLRKNQNQHILWNDGSIIFSCKIFKYRKVRKYGA